MPLGFSASISSAKSSSTASAQQSISFNPNLVVSSPESSINPKVGGQSLESSPRVDQGGSGGSIAPSFGGFGGEASRSGLLQPLATLASSSFGPDPGFGVFGADVGRGSFRQPAGVEEVTSSLSPTMALLLVGGAAVLLVLLKK